MTLLVETPLSHVTHFLLSYTLTFAEQLLYENYSQKSIKYY